MSYILPSEFVTKMVDAGESKIYMATRDVLIRAFMAGAMLFPVGFCMLYLMGFEHSIVNMFLFPFALMMGGEFGIMDYFIWNEIPTVLGNLVGGLSFTGLTLYATHIRTAPKRCPVTPAVKERQVLQSA